MKILTSYILIGSVHCFLLISDPCISSCSLQRHPTVTPSSYPQAQAPIVNNPAFWERLGLDTLGTDTLFFAFYHQPVHYPFFTEFPDITLCV